jgi:hypothetical protein
MKRLFTITLSFCLILTPTVLAGLDGKKAAYQGGTTKDADFPGAKSAVEGILNTSDPDNLRFEYKLQNQPRVYTIQFNQIIDIEYGQKAGRRVGASIATAILLTPLGLFLLFSKKRKHFVTIGYKGASGKEEVAVFELGKDIVRVTLPILEARSGKKIEYQDDEAKKSSKG